ncbi:hypothetical protein BXZ70DRAFT_884754 [Cristinia sonorae]|uniref:Protein kinase domain-containing protein n=1 Tax=Cristinia sonorae TaxID=1940300 RepID=A0A8K0UXP5_9AGAR|nr:hypothetical protein BXZ70DRAFT_884754 [Cristinia sonorae]
MRGETFWRDHQPWLEERGYMLRPRYHPGWVASWKSTGESPFECEDGAAYIFPQIMDGTRISDGEMVLFKKIIRSKHPYEVEISQMFSREPLRSHPRNHCVPILEVLDSPHEPGVTLIVLPLLREYDDPPFETLGEAVEFFRQIFEFMHQCHVAHRDCMFLNIMMDPRPMFPKMYHPVNTVLTRDHQDLVGHYSRTFRPVKYYLIDFGISRVYDASETSPREHPIFGGDKSVPEFQYSIDPCDPFATDVYYIGNVVRARFMTVRSFRIISSAKYKFMTSLIDDMVQDDPSKRPTMDEVVDRFEKLYKALPSSALRSRFSGEGKRGINYSLHCSHVLIPSACPSFTCGVGAVRDITPLSVSNKYPRNIATTSIVSYSLICCACHEHQSPCWSSLVATVLGRYIGPPGKVLTTASVSRRVPSPPRGQRMSFPAANSSRASHNVASSTDSLRAPYNDCNGAPGSLRRAATRFRFKSPTSNLWWTEEEFWRDHQSWLEERGYMLRPRYLPGWVASWKSTGESPFACEDGAMNMLPQVMDGTRISDGEMVLFKKILRSKHPYEVEISQMFSREPLRSHPRNHCVPILEVMDSPHEPGVTLIVLPLLRAYDSPAFETLGEAVEFFHQIFEGLQFMHQCHVAHRDCMFLNIMMDPRPMFPKMYHPVDTVLTRDYQDLVGNYSRTFRPVKYYLIDFGISRVYDASETSPREHPIFGGDKSVPEFQYSIDPCDPFATDVYYIGNVVRARFMTVRSFRIISSLCRFLIIAKYKFMTSLIDDMVQDDPSKRPTMDEVVDRFEKLYKALPSSALRSRFSGEGKRGIVRPLYHLVLNTIYGLMGRKALPRPPEYPLHTFSC